MRGYISHLTSIVLHPVSHLGQSPGEHNPPSQHSRLYSLREQIEHKAQCLDLLRERFPPETQYILMGHSMGAYVCAEVCNMRGAVLYIHLF